MQPTATAIKTYTIDEAHSTIRFWVRHLMISKVHGEIDDVKGTVVYNEDDPSKSLLDVAINLTSLSTKQEQRDAHLKSGDFFDVEKYSTMTYRSKRILKTGEREFEIVGDLMLHGTTREVPISAEITEEIANPYGGYKVGVTARGMLDREDFGMTWNQALETGGVLVGKEVHFDIDLELDRP